MTEQIHFHFSLSCIGEGNGNPLQCSCLENPRDGKVWWAAVYGIAQSRTRPKRLSSSSNMRLGIFLLGFTQYGTLFSSWTWLTISSSMLGRFSTIISSKIFLYPFSLLFLWPPEIMQMLLHLISSQRSLRLS